MSRGVGVAVGVAAGLFALAGLVWWSVMLSLDEGWTEYGLMSQLVGLALLGIGSILGFWSRWEHSRP